MNNGITIVADRVEQVTTGAKVRMRMWNPQVVNGQQTVRSLERAKGNHSKVLIRVIQLVLLCYKLLVAMEIGPRAVW